MTDRITQALEALKEAIREVISEAEPISSAAPAEAEQPAASEPTVTYATIRDGDDELHIECRFSDGQKFAAITVDKDFPGLAQTVANALAAHPAQQTASETVARWSDRRFYNRRQQKWCEYYERTTGFEPLMCDYEAENESFVQAAEKSIQWYEDHTSDTYLAITRGWIPGSEYDTGESYVD